MSLLKRNRNRGLQLLLLSLTCLLFTTGCSATPYSSMSTTGDASTACIELMKKETPTNNNTAKPGVGYTVTFNGKVVQLSNSILIQDDKILLPLEEIADMIGVKTTYDSIYNVTIAKDKDSVVEVPIGYTFLVNNGEKISMNSERSVLYNSDTYLPAKYIDEQLSVTITTSADKKLINITTESEVKVQQPTTTAKSQTQTPQDAKINESSVTKKDSELASTPTPKQTLAPTQKPIQTPTPTQSAKPTQTPAPTPTPTQTTKSVAKTTPTEKPKTDAKVKVTLPKAAVINLSDQLNGVKQEHQDMVDNNEFMGSQAVWRTCTKFTSDKQIFKVLPNKTAQQVPTIIRVGRYMTVDMDIDSNELNINNTTVKVSENFLNIKGMMNSLIVFNDGSYIDFKKTNISEFPDGKTVADINYFAFATDNIYVFVNIQNVDLEGIK